jgi:hypothetical protein
MNQLRNLKYERFFSRKAAKDECAFSDEPINNLKFLKEFGWK